MYFMPVRRTDSLTKTPTDLMIDMSAIVEDLTNVLHAREEDGFFN
jgi:hypothetical protein